MKLSRFPVDPAENVESIILSIQDSPQKEIPLKKASPYKVTQFLRSLISIKLSLVLSFLSLVLLPTLAILIVMTLDLNTYINEEASANSNLASQWVNSKIWALLTPPFKATNTLAFIFQQQVVDTSDISTSMKLLFGLASSNPTFQFTFYNAIKNNVQVGYGRDESGAIIFDYANGGFLYTFDASQTNQLTGAVSFPGSTSSPLDVINQPSFSNAISNYVPHWSAPFYSVSNNMYSSYNSTFGSILMTAITPFQNSSGQTVGYAGVTISLGLLSTYIQQIYISENSAIYIIENQGSYMIAASISDDTLYKITTLGVMNRVRLSQSTQPFIAHIGSQLEVQYGTNLSGVKMQQQIIIFDSRTYSVYPESFVDVYGMDWTVLVIINVDDFQGPSISFRDTVFIVDAIIVCASIILGLLLAFAITIPLDKLGKKMNDLRRLKLMSNDEKKSKFVTSLLGGKFFSEMEVLEDDFRKMKAAVEGFIKYIPREIVSTFLNHPNAETLFRPFSINRELCLIFTDIKDFTTISENLKPRQLIEMLMIYFDELSVVIHQNQGTLDKYIGDSIMCFWNAPLEQEDFVFKACKTALAINEACKGVSKRFMKEGLPAFLTRIGVHSGECLVGNSGSSIRLAYTAMGEHVTLASSMESMNKLYGTSILCSEVVYENLKGRFDFRVVDTIETSINPNGIKVYEMLETACSEKRLIAAKRFNKIYIDLFLNREFDLALIEFQQHLDEFPHDLAAQNMIDMCNRYLMTPPPANWTGINIDVNKWH